MNKSSNIVLPSYKPFEVWKTKEELIWLQALLSGDQKVIHAELLKCQRDPWYWMRAWVLTENAHSRSMSPFEPFPDKPHLFTLTQMWIEFLRLLVPKSRQVMATWLFSCLYLHEAIFYPSRLTFIQSKKEEDSDQILERAWVVYKHLPEFMRLWQPATRTFCHIRFKRNRSHLYAIPEGPEHIRQFTASGYMMDEAVYQADVDKVLAAAGPSLGAKGRLTMLSSVGPSLFSELVFDRA